jgi:hypothetical protein
MTAFLSLDWRSESSGSHASLVDRALGGRFELVFCGTDCLGDHLNEKIDELEGHRGPGWCTADGRSPIEWDELDPGIRDVVRYLRDLGFDTHYSCEGGKGHMCQYPMVALLAHTETLESLRRRAVSALLRGGYRDFRSTIRFSHGATDRPYSGWGGGLEVAIEFVIDRKPIRPYVKRPTDSSRSKRRSVGASTARGTQDLSRNAAALADSCVAQNRGVAVRTSTKRGGRRS